ncbi:MAG: HNH endonuclease [Bacteroidetes bacterium]|nr:HNH endonuclease [Bacteroidota bacterium]
MAKGGIVTGRDPGTYRNDACGKLIKFSEHGNTSSDQGWEIDHKQPVSKAGSDYLFNLQPLYWKTNREKGDTYPWRCR